MLNANISNISAISWCPGILYINIKETLPNTSQIIDYLYLAHVLIQFTNPIINKLISIKQNFLIDPMG